VNVRRTKSLWGYAKRAHSVALWFAIATGFTLLLGSLRKAAFASDSLLDSYLEISGCLLAFTVAAIALVRFRGARDRISLILAFAFLLSGLIEAAARLASYRALVSGHPAHLTVPEAWMVSRTLLAVLMVAALAVEKRIPHARDPKREMVGTIVVVGMIAYLIGVAYFTVQAEAPIHPGAIVPRPWDILPAAIYLLAAVCYWRRLANAHSAFDSSICIAAGMNVACHLAATQSQHLLDAPYTLAQVLKVVSYAVVLGGALVDTARLFDEVHHLATNDPLTGLANYRRLTEVLDSELQRSGRTGREFAVLLLDLDRLKGINDRYGHVVGSQALRRLADILRAHGRSIDTAARYGGDEFALVLPETGERAGRRVAARICDRLAQDEQQPALSVSVGVAVFPRDGVTVDQLLRAADRDLYGMKAHRAKRSSGQESLTVG